MRVIACLTAALAAVTFVVGAWVGRLDERSRWQDGTGLREPVAVHLEEDEVGWNCRTMGNRICGE